MKKIQEAFELPLQLSRPDPNKTFMLQTDASHIGLAAVLYQEEEETRRIVGYASARVNAAAKNYHSNELECLAVVWAIKNTAHI